MRLKVDAPGRELSSSTVPGVSLQRSYKAQAEWDARYSCIRSVARYCVTVTAKVVLCVVAVTPLLDCAEMVTV